MNRLLSPDHLYEASDVLKRPCAVPATPGVYAWYFNRMPGFVRPDECHKVGDHILLYVGITPSLARQYGNRQDKQRGALLKWEADLEELLRSSGFLVGPRYELEVRLDEDGPPFEWEGAPVALERDRIAERDGLLRWYAGDHSEDRSIGASILSS